MFILSSFVSGSRRTHMVKAMYATYSLYSTIFLVFNRLESHQLSSEYRCIYAEPMNLCFMRSRSV